MQQVEVPPPDCGSPPSGTRTYFYKTVRLGSSPAAVVMLLFTTVILHISRLCLESSVDASHHEWVCVCAWRVVTTPVAMNGCVHLCMESGDYACHHECLCVLGERE